MAKYELQKVLYTGSQSSTRTEPFDRRADADTAYRNLSARSYHTARIVRSKDGAVLVSKHRCRNCGDETTFPGNAEGERVSAGWCVGCHRQFGTSSVDLKGNVHWKDESKTNVRKTPFDPRDKA